VEFYQRAFDAPLAVSYPNDNGTYMHAELDIQGQILAVSERDSVHAGRGETVTGNTMQFCLQYGAGNEDMVKKAYGVLKESAEIISPLAPCSYSPLMAALIDKYGVHWCLFV
jgi:PhnB protein